MPSTTAAIVLAAGQGTRMRSALPKVLHPLFGEPMLVHVLRAAARADCGRLIAIVAPSHRPAVEEALAKSELAASVELAEQAVPRGTGDAARAALPHLPADCEEAVILCGDTPMLSAATLNRLKAARAGHDVAVLAMSLDDPSGYGRVLLDPAGKVARIVEHKDATEAELRCRLVNSGVYAVRVAFLRTALSELKADNAQGEYYLTDIVARAAATGRATTCELEAPSEARGVNTRRDLGEVLRAWQQKIVMEHQAQGVTFVAPETAIVEPSVELAPDVRIGPHVQLTGASRIGSHASIDGPSVVHNSTVGAHSRVRAFSHIDGATLEERVEVGPFVRLRPGALLETQSRAGNFVEIKQARLGRHAKANHLAYIGDATVGEGSNIGAGTIFCNYDGFAKHKTQIGAQVFVGSNTTLVAPVSLGDASMTAAGSTITSDVPAQALAFGRAKQVTLDGRAQALREKLAQALKAKSTGPSSPNR